LAEVLVAKREVHLRAVRVRPEREERPLELRTSRGVVAALQQSPGFVEESVRGRRILPLLGAGRARSAERQRGEENDRETSAPWRRASEYRRKDHGPTSSINSSARAPS